MALVAAVVAVVKERTSQWALALLFAGTGVFHLLRPDSLTSIVPPWLPDPLLLVYVSGVCELFGAAGLLVARTRRLAAWGLIALLVAVFPANVQMLLDARTAGASLAWQALLWFRMALQPLLILWIYRAAARQSVVSPQVPSSTAHDSHSSSTSSG